MLWRIDGSQLALLGSIHVLDAESLPLSDAAWSAFNTATRVAFEHDFTQVPDVSFARFPPNESLSSVVPASLFAATQQLCGDLSLDIGTVSRFHPWFVGVCLALEAAKRDGLDPGNGVDKKLLTLAHAQGKSIEYLESVSAALL